MPLYTVINIILIFLEEEAHEGSLHSIAAGSVGGRRAQGGGVERKGLEGRQGQTSGKGKDAGLYLPQSNGRRSKRKTEVIVKRSLWPLCGEQVVELVGKELKQSPVSQR